MIKTKEEFEALMEAIDRVLRERNLPIHARPIHAVRELCMRLKIGLTLVSRTSEAIPGDYAGESLSAHIRDWYDVRYGDTLKADFSVGATVAYLVGDLWKVRLPLIWPFTSSRRSKRIASAAYTDSPWRKRPGPYDECPESD